MTLTKVITRSDEHLIGQDMSMRTDANLKSRHEPFEEFNSACPTTHFTQEGARVTVYNFFLKRYMNVVVDLHNTGIPFSSFPIIVVDCWEHSYYRDYLKDRRSYVFAMMKELKWSTIEDRVRRAERMAEAS
ncbi:MAG: hypothetical protein EBV42_05595, partial [Actinobacteria bacterium]|nr:hypothetical protein [Actinomycetota bacterium]